MRNKCDFQPYPEKIHWNEKNRSINGNCSLIFALPRKH